MCIVYLMMKHAATNNNNNNNKTIILVAFTLMMEKNQMKITTRLTITIIKTITATIPRKIIICIQTTRAILMMKKTGNGITKSR